MVVLPQVHWDFQTSAPSRELSQPLQALWWLKKGDFKLGDAWEQAHGICQTAEGQKAYDWVHALAHWIEGDEGNSDYWYRRVGEERTSDDPGIEWDHIAAQLSA